ncbi:hypothetical protein IMCC3317_38680 [Kordia antarctica]|uniref:GTP-binding protein n=1 Tax=Kordia antarctica TaxID=1218801 RepID=A0A7L4ZPE3_9FLAO|nr:DUF2452 domain-containing protein [Kordia antarctica]QHI38475.1 hypothetical protein IMCC3317_38680 [Kordia antarctica]
MQEEDKKPDNVVFDEETQKYDAALKPYATGVGAPVITTPDTVTWKNVNIDKVNKQVKAKYEELKAEYDALMEKFEYNNLIYSAKFNFEPIVGEIYHLYRDKKQQSFLSIIAPNQCRFDYVQSFRLNADKMWEVIGD